MNPILQAKMFATQKHVLDNHQLYGPLPYTHHLEAVAAIVEAEYAMFAPHVGDFYAQDAIVAAWLHDVLEDTRKKPNRVKVRDIEETFGARVARVVDAVTSVEAPDRRTKNALTYPRIRAMGQDAVLVKLADRVANVEYGGASIENYRSEHADFDHGLAITLTGSVGEMCRRLWRRLDEALGCASKVR
jgi:(p)ppGpp synthase/HD superfamily hydrolase